MSVDEARSLLNRQSIVFFKLDRFEVSFMRLENFKRMLEIDEESRINKKTRLKISFSEKTKKMNIDSSLFILSSEEKIENTISESEKENEQENSESDIAEDVISSIKNLIKRKDDCKCRDLNQSFLNKLR
jgi:hypothetical protein